MLLLESISSIPSLERAELASKLTKSAEFLLVDQSYTILRNHSLMSRLKRCRPFQNHCQKRQVHEVEQMKKLKKKIVPGIVSKSIISWLVNVLSLQLDSSTIIKHPNTISTTEGISYLYTGFSFRNLIERNVLITIPVAVLVERRTTSQNGNTKTCQRLPMNNRMKPMMQFLSLKTDFYLIPFIPLFSTPIKARFINMYPTQLPRVAITSDRNASIPSKFIFTF